MAYADLVRKIAILEECNGEVVLQYLRNKMVRVMDKQTLGEVVVFMADEWKLLMEATGVDKDQHSEGPDQTGLNAQAEGDGQEDPRGELRHNER